MLTQRATCFGLVVVALALFGCIPPEQPAATTLSPLIVQGILDARTGVQTIFITRARTGAYVDTSAYAITKDEPVRGANITLTLPNGKTLASNQFGPDSAIATAAGSYTFRTADFGFDPTTGGTYYVHVMTATGEEASGSTTMPTVAPAVSTISGSFGGASYFRRLQDTLRLSWPPVPGARAYEVVIRSPVSEEYRIFSDTSVAIAGTKLTIRGDMVFPPGVAVNVIISAVDANYYDYYRAQSDPFAGAPPSHLTGAVGVFGSIAIILASPISVR